MKTPVRVSLVGAAGRMGQAIIRASEACGVAEVVAKLNRGDDIAASLDGCDVVIDFTHAVATTDICHACLAAQKPLVIGTTGHSEQQLAAIAAAARKIPILLAANFSVGVNTLFWLTRKAAEFLGDGFDVEIVETHHRMKKDAPSGTAKRLAALVADARGVSSEKTLAHGRVGQIGERPVGEIGMHAIRAGDVVGEHTILFATAGERLELTHKATSRDTFAIGALRAAEWIVGKPAALYNMEDVLGLR
jgi:4-hydroxy-tetrahydrodipicolinate reductase